MVADVLVRWQDKDGNEAADRTADPLFCDLHRFFFFIAVARTVANYDGEGGSAPDPLVWSSGALNHRSQNQTFHTTIWPGFLARATLEKVTARLASHHHLSR